MVLEAQKSKHPMVRMFVPKPFHGGRREGKRYTEI
jgi:hypothetical protein